MAPMTLQTNGLCPWRSTKGWKWSEISAKPKPASSAPRAWRTRSPGACSSLDSEYPTSISVLLEGVVHDDVPVSDLAAPGARRNLTVLHEILETLEVVLDLSAVETECRADGLLHALRLVLHFDRDACAFGDRHELHAPVVAQSAGRAPRDDAVRLLLDDLGVPLLPLAVHLGDPVNVTVVGLPHGDDALHEARELLELCPLAVGRGHGDIDIDRLLDGSHPKPPFRGVLLVSDPAAEDRRSPPAPLSRAPARV